MDTNTTIVKEDAKVSCDQGLISFTLRLTSDKIVCGGKGGSRRGAHCNAMLGLLGLNIQRVCELSFCRCTSLLGWLLSMFLLLERQIQR